MRGENNSYIRNPLSTWDSLVLDVSVVFKGRVARLQQRKKWGLWTLWTCPLLCSQNSGRRRVFLVLLRGCVRHSGTFWEWYFLVFFKWKKVSRKLLFYISESVLEYLLLLYLIWIFQHIKRLSLSSISGTDQWCMKQFIVTWRYRLNSLKGTFSEDVATPLSNQETCQVESPLSWSCGVS